MLKQIWVWASIKKISQALKIKKISAGLGIKAYYDAIHRIQI